MKNLNEVNFGQLKAFFRANTNYELVSIVEEPLGYPVRISLFDLVNGKITDYNLENEEERRALLTIIEES